jgi:transposase
LVVLGTHEDDYAVEVVAHYAAAEASCPRCDRTTRQVHQWHRQRKQDASLWAKPVSIVLLKRRFRCRPCRYVFTEADPVCGQRRRTTCRLRGTVARQAEEATVRAVSRWHGVSEGLVQRSWLEAHLTLPVPPAPHVLLGLDGFCVRRPGRMWTGLWDLETRNPIAVVAGERKADMEILLGRYAARHTVQAVCIDLSEASRQALQLVLPDAAIVADKFHVIALAGRALHEVHGERRLRSTIAWLLQRGIERLSAADKTRLAAALRQDRVLTTAWTLKEELRAVYRAPTPGAADRALTAWIHAAEASGIRPFVRTARTLRRWRTEVLNYWRYPITNAVVEGKHNRVKVLKRRAYGYRNDRTFQLRILNLIHTD